MLIKICVVALCLSTLFVKPGMVAAPFEDMAEPPLTKAEEQRIQLNDTVQIFLALKDSPLEESTEFITTLPHWQLVIAISAMESRYCRFIKNNHNCWGIMKGGKLRNFESFEDGAQYTSNLISYWQKRGKWLTPEQMNGSYVVPRNDTWLAVVKNNINYLNDLSK